MNEKSGRYKEPSGKATGNPHNRDFTEVLGSILEAATTDYPRAEELGIRLSLARIGNLTRDDVSDFMTESPVAAAVALRQQFGEKAAILTDIPTASILANIVSGGRPIAKETLGGDDLVFLFRALNPIVDALSAECEDSLGSPLGTIENVEISTPEKQDSLIGELTEPLCQTTILVEIGREKSGRIILILPLDLAESLGTWRPTSMEATVSEMEQNELLQEEIDALLPLARETQAPAAVAPSPNEVPVETSAQNIDLILDIQLKLAARLGQVEMQIGEILKLVPGSVIDIDRFVEEPIELLVNDRLIARGEIVVVQENFGVRITEIVSQKDRIRSLR
jgi:flagellar motor switch protein FliN/FliY